MDFNYGGSRLCRFPRAFNRDERRLNFFRSHETRIRLGFCALKIRHNRIFLFIICRLTTVESDLRSTFWTDKMRFRFVVFRKVEVLLEKRQ